MEKSKIIWNDISIEIKYISNYLKNIHQSSGQLAHIEVYSDNQLPITNTGYRSIFLSFSEVEKAGGAVAYVKSMLDDSSNSKEWKAYQLDQQQINLF